MGHQGCLAQLGSQIQDHQDLDNCQITSINQPDRSPLVEEEVDDHLLNQYRSSKFQIRNLTKGPPWWTKSGRPPQVKEEVDDHLLSQYRSSKSQTRSLTKGPPWLSKLVPRRGTTGAQWFNRKVD